MPRQWQISTSDWNSNIFESLRMMNHIVKCDNNLAVRGHVRGTDMYGADMCGADMWSEHVCGADMCGADMCVECLY